MCCAGAIKNAATSMCLDHGYRSRDHIFLSCFDMHAHIFSACRLSPGSPINAKPCKSSGRTQEYDPRSDSLWRRSWCCTCAGGCCSRGTGSAPNTTSKSALFPRKSPSATGAQRTHTSSGSPQVTAPIPLIQTTSHSLVVPMTLSADVSADVSVCQECSRTSSPKSVLLPRQAVTSHSRRVTSIIPTTYGN